MAIIPRPPLTDDDGEARELREEDFLWMVKTQDFGGSEGVHAFLDRRSSILDTAEEFGIPEEAFLGLEPSKPGFEHRAVEALRAILKVAEEKDAEARRQAGLAAE